VLALYCFRSVLLEDEPELGGDIVLPEPEGRSRVEDPLDEEPLVEGLVPMLEPVVLDGGRVVELLPEPIEVEPELAPEPIVLELLPVEGETAVEPVRLF
jgi:hypothetical protein